MLKLLISSILFLGLGAFNIEARERGVIIVRPYNSNMYHYVAVPMNGNNHMILEGRGYNNQIHNIWRDVKHRLNSQVRHGNVRNGTQYRVIVYWKNRRFVHYMTARNLQFGVSIDFFTGKVIDFRWD